MSTTEAVAKALLNYHPVSLGLLALGVWQLAVWPACRWLGDRLRG